MLRDKDIENFLECPKKYMKFTKGNNDTYINSIVKTVVWLFVKELEKDSIPSLRSMRNYWGRRLDDMHKNGSSLSDINNLSIALINFYNEYKNKLYYTGLRVVAVWLPITFRSEYGEYMTTIPVILSDKTGCLHPVFISDEKIDIKRNNAIRFASAILEDKIQNKIDDIFFVRIRRFPANVTIEKMVFNYGELERTRSELVEIITVMSTGFSIPNTAHCSDCKFSRQCHL